MKYFKRLKIYKASSVAFDAENVEASSYGWWKFVSKINGFVVFNNYNYSPSTCKHQSKVRRLMADLGIKIDVVVYTCCDLRGTLRYGQSADVGITALKQAYSVQDLERARKIEKVFKLKFDQKTIQGIYNEVEEELCNAYLLRAERYEEKKRKALKQRLESHLENEVCFRDYDIVDKEKFGDPDSPIASKVAVHQCVDADTLEADVQNALYNFGRDGFGSVVFYV